MARGWRWLRRGLWVLLLTGGCGWVVAWYLPSWLANSDAPVAVDAIVVLSGNPTRAIAAARLYHAGYAADVYLAQPVRTDMMRRLEAFGITYPVEAEISKQVLLLQSVPAEHVLLSRALAQSTVEEAETWERELPTTVHRLLVVTSPYHVRRARLIFRRAMPGREVLVVASTEEPYPARWWTRQESAIQLSLEFMKLTFYLLGGRFYAH